MFSTHVISPQQSEADAQAPPPPTQHCIGRLASVESELTPHVKPSQQPWVPLHIWPAGAHIAIGSGRHMKVWQLRPIAHSLESMQNDP